MARAPDADAVLVGRVRPDPSDPLHPVVTQAPPPRSPPARTRSARMARLGSWAMMLRVAAVHVGALGVFFVPFRWSMVALAVLVFFGMQFGFEGICHRYFAHRSYRTSRTFQLLLAVWGSATGQKGMLWWADTHRQHHRHTDTPADAHSPVHHGLFHAHVAWLWQPENLDAAPDRVQDLRAFPEIVWLDRHWDLCPLAVLVLASALGGVEALVWAALLPYALSLNTTWMTNSVTHFRERPGLGGTGLGGTALRWRRFATDDSTNNAPWLSVLMMGSNWHNNHHRYPNAARAGFYPGELDLSYLVLRAMAALGLIWDLRPVPEAVLEEGRRARPEA